MYWFLLTTLLVLPDAHWALDNGLARTPPMGWMSWQRYRCQIDCDNYPDDCINERLIRRTTDRLVSDGWRELGYRYVITDDCWMAKTRERETMEIVADQKRFPNGIMGLGEYIHSKDMLFGIYLDYGTRTCEGYPGSVNWLELDARSLAKWKVDYVKVDGCYSAPSRMPAGYEEFGKHMNRTGRPMVFSCSYPAYTNWQTNHTLIDWAQLSQTCSLWRFFGDVQDSWQSVRSIITVYRDHGELLRQWAGPGHWNDPDMLLLGNFGLSRDQSRVQMGMWCMLAAPLLISMDMANIDPFSESLLKNPHLLAIDQDEGGHQAAYLKTKTGIQLWTRPLSQPINGSWAVALLNFVGGGGPIHVTTTLDELQVGVGSDESIYFTLTDVFTGEIVNAVRRKESFTMAVNPTGIFMFKVRVKST